MLYSWDYMDTSQTQEEVANVIKIFQEGVWQLKAASCIMK